jgi:hypothetical protein
LRFLVPELRFPTPLTLTLLVPLALDRLAPGRRLGVDVHLFGSLSLGLLGLRDDRLWSRHGRQGRKVALVYQSLAESSRHLGSVAAAADGTIWPLSVSISVSFPVPVPVATTVLGPWR